MVLAEVGNNRLDNFRSCPFASQGSIGLRWYVHAVYIEILANCGPLAQYLIKVVSVHLQKDIAGH